MASGLWERRITCRGNEEGRRGNGEQAMMPGLKSFMYMTRQKYSTVIMFVLSAGHMPVFRMSYLVWSLMLISLQWLKENLKTLKITTVNFTTIITYAVFTKIISELSKKKSIYYYFPELSTTFHFTSSIQQLLSRDLRFMATEQLTFAVEDHKMLFESHRKTDKWMLSQSFFLSESLFLINQGQISSFSQSFKVIPQFSPHIRRLIIHNT